MTDKNNKKFMEVLDWALDNNMEPAAIAEFFMQGLATISASSLAQSTEIDKEARELAALFIEVLKEKHESVRKIYSPMASAKDILTDDENDFDRSKLPEYLN